MVFVLYYTYQNLSVQNGLLFVNVQKKGAVSTCQCLIVKTGETISDEGIIAQYPRVIVRKAYSYSQLIE